MILLQLRKIGLHTLERLDIAPHIRGQALYVPRALSDEIAQLALYKLRQNRLLLWPKTTNTGSANVM